MYMSNQSTEKTLIARFRQGDAEAFNTVYNRHYSTLRYFSFRLISQKSEAEAITVDTFMKLFFLCRNFDTMANIRAFLYVTARNACYDYLSYKHRHPAEHQDYQPETQENGAYGATRENGNVLMAVFDAIENLPAAYHQVFKLAYVKGQKVTSIAEDLRLKEQAVRNYKKRSIQLLRIALFQKNLPSAALTCLSMVKKGRQTAMQQVVSTIYAETIQ
jgi:RNA polymerase sigma factor (sigma-70 family)